MLTRIPCYPGGRAQRLDWRIGILLTGRGQGMDAEPTVARTRTIGVTGPWHGA